MKRSPRLIRRREVLNLTSFSQAGLYREMKKGFPRPVALGPKSAAWVEAEVVEWINQRIERPRNARPCIVQRAAGGPAQ